MIDPCLLLGGEVAAGHDPIRTPIRFLLHSLSSSLQQTSLILLASLLLLPVYLLLGAPTNIEQKFQKVGTGIDRD